MNQKHIGIILLIIAVLIAVFIAFSQQRESASVDQYVQKEGSCFLEDGTCLHKQNMYFFVFGWALAGVLFLFGIYLTFFDKTQKFLIDHQIQVSSALASAKKQERKKDEFNAFISGFNEEEQRVLKAIKDQEGIKQSTLRYRTNISKTSLSLILKSLEDRKIISRKTSGKTKEVYLVNKF